MDAGEIIRKAEEQFAKLSKKTVEGIAGLSRTEEGWEVWLEVLERRAIPDTMDILGLYKIQMDSDGNLLGLERKKLRKRGETAEGVDEVFPG
jgi:hypothetical protein